jgi:hypothetical protein
MILLYYLILIFILSISGKDKRKDAEILLNVWVEGNRPKTLALKEVDRHLASAPSISEEKDEGNYKNVKKVKYISY